jgi:hypothetical protein
MKRRARTRARSEQLVSYLDGELSADEAAAVVRASIESGEHRRTLESLTRLRDGLRAPVPELEGRDLARAVREAARTRSAPTGSGSVGAGSPWRHVLGFAMAAAVVLCAGVSLRWLEQPRGLAQEEGFAAKAGLTRDATRWAGIQVYRVPTGGSPERLRARLARNDGLLFSYTNLGAESFGHLMVFAIDARQRRHWFYPAPSGTGADATSIAIAAGQAEVPLTELIRDEFPEGPLAIYAAFTRQPLRVSEVEAWLQLHPEGGTQFAPLGSAVSRSEVQVDSEGPAGP